MKKVIITGISGQDGGYMAELCLEKNCEVFGMVRRTSSVNQENFKHLLANPKFHVFYGDLSDSSSINDAVKKIKPDYFFNFAAQSFVGCSWDIPEETFMVGAVGVLKCLEAIRNYAPYCRFYNAGSSEQFGDVAYSPQDEKHPFRPRSPYAAAKCAAHLLIKVYRESYNLYAIQGLLFNHESEKRGEEFVTRKITMGVARIIKALHNGQEFKPIQLGNLDSKRDWSHARDFMDGVWRMMNQEQFNPKMHSIGEFDGVETMYFDLKNSIQEYVLASGETHTIREFVEKAFGIAHIPFEWVGKGVDEKLMILDIGNKSQILVEVDSKLFRPNEVDLLLGNPTRVKEELGWSPKISFDKLVELMVLSDLEHANSRKD